MSRRLGGRFTLGREIGAGGMSVVYLGHDEVLDRPVAVKVLKGGLEDDEGISARFRREGRTAARLSHPNIVPVYDAGEGELDGREVSFIVMEYVAAGDLKGMVEGKGKLLQGELAPLGAEVASGLAHAHDKGVVHRDLKPQNILMDEYGRPKLADFGIARALGASQSTRTGAYLGTALYSSPEQLRGEEVTPKSDVYSLGVTLYYAAAGQPPFTGDALAVAHQHVSKLPVVPTARGAVLGEDLENTILACMEKDPDRRPTASELVERLLQVGTLAAGVVPDNAEETMPVEKAPAITTPESGDVAGGAARGAAAVGSTLAGALVGAAGAARAAGVKGLGVAARGVREWRGSASGTPGRPAFPLYPSRQTFRPERDRRVALLAVGAALLALLVIAVGASALLGPEEEPAAPGEVAGSLRETAEAPAAPAASDEAPAAPEDAVPAGSLPPPGRAERAVFDTYVEASYRDFEASWGYLSRRLQREVGSPERWGDRFGEITYVYFTRYPEARVVGETAEVGFQVRETFVGGARLTTGTWVCVVEDGEWKLDRLENEETETY